jgi:hypothetical protein
VAATGGGPPNFCGSGPEGGWLAIAFLQKWHRADLHLQTFGGGFFLWTEAGQGHPTVTALHLLGTFQKAESTCALCPRLLDLLQFMQKHWAMTAVNILDTDRASTLHL